MVHSTIVDKPIVYLMKRELMCGLWWHCILENFDKGKVGKFQSNKLLNIKLFLNKHLPALTVDNVKASVYNVGQIHQNLFRQNVQSLMMPNFPNNYMIQL